MPLLRYLDDLRHDLTYAARQARRSPAFTAVAVLSLALGISANTTIFSAINAVLVRPLPYPNSDRLVTIEDNLVKQPAARLGCSRGDVASWRAESRVLDRIEFLTNSTPTVMVGSGVSERINVQYISPGLPSFLGVRPAAGRFASSEELKEHEAVVILSYPFWQNRFGGDPKVVGRTFFADNQNVLVIGVASRGFDFFGQGGVDVFWPLDDLSARAATDRDNRWLNGVARLAPGVSLERAQAGMSVAARRMEQAYPETNRGLGVKLMPLREGLFGWSRIVLYPMFGAVGFVLLIACANVASLLLSRASARRKEVGIRTTLGAGRGRLIRQMLTENVLLALLGGVAGIGLTCWAVRLFIAISPNWFPQARLISIDVRVLGFTLAVSILTGILFGLVPAFRTSRIELAEALKEGGRGSSAGSRHRARSAFVVVEVSLALMLLVCAGLLTNTFLRILHTSPGFRQDQIATVEIRLTGPKYFDTTDYTGRGLDLATPQVGHACRRILEKVQSVPGVQAAALIDWLPMIKRDTSGYRMFTIAGQPAAGANEHPFAILSAVSSDYFRVMGVPLLKGRRLNEQDTEQAPWVVLINEAMAASYWPHQDPVGHIIRIPDPGGEERPRQVVGVVGNTRQRAARQPAAPEMYVSYSQQPPHCTGEDTETRLHKSIVFRTRYETPGLNQAVLRAIREVDSESPVYGLSPIRQVVSDSMSVERFFMQVLGGFSALALLLAAIGIYGVISYSVIERSHELGIRMALGARPHQIIGMVLREGTFLMLIGTAIGLAAAYFATPVFAKFLYGVKSHDPLTLAAAVLFLFLVTLAATYIPAWRATKSDPLVALRHE